MEQPRDENRPDGSRQPQQEQQSQSGAGNQAGQQQQQIGAGREQGGQQQGGQSNTGQSNTGQSPTGQSTAGQQQQFDASSGQMSGGGDQGSLAEQIREHMDVIDQNGARVGTVDQVDGDRIKLTRDSTASGEHEYLPLSEVAGIESGCVRLRQQGGAGFGMESGN